MPDLRLPRPDRHTLGCVIEARVIGPRRLVGLPTPRLHDVSRDGLSIVCGTPCEVGEYVSVLVHPPAGAAGEPVAVLGTVRWCNPHETGTWRVGASVGVGWENSLPELMFHADAPARRSA